MFCSNCGKVIDDSAKFCPDCGTPVHHDSVSPLLENSASNQPNLVSPKSRTIAAILAFFLGFVGAHRFYVGKIGTGIAIILLSWCLIGEVWALIDLIVILCGNFKDKEGFVLSDWDAKF